MSTNDYILNLLNIKDKNIYILTNNEEIRKIKGKNYKIIERTNNLIKCLKRIAFGYRKYDNFISRIFLIITLSIF